MSIAIVFPGQGAQAVGMLDGLDDSRGIVSSVFGEASERLGFDLWSLVNNGPREILDQTENTQPALLACGMAVWRIWQQAGGDAPVLLAGHSLGEYTALTAAQVLDFGDAVALVRDRGRFMQQAVPTGQGAMAAILGLADEQVTEICKQISAAETVSVANFNSPGQVVIAGHASAVATASTAVKQAGAKKVVMLDVSVPSHCALMQIAAAKLASRFAEIAFSNAVVPVVQNVDAQQRTDAQEIKKALLLQIHQPVRWTETIMKIRSAGISTIIECGPGRILTGLIRRIDRDLKAYSVYDSATLATALSATQT